MGAHEGNRVEGRSPKSLLVCATLRMVSCAGRPDGLVVEP